MPASSIIIKSWNDIVPYLDHSSPLSLLIPSSVLHQIGAPIVKAYQDMTSFYPHLSLTAECDTAGQALSCLYHGVEKITYKDPSVLRLFASVKGKNSN